MNAKDIANKHGMLSPDEIDLLQECVVMLSKVRRKDFSDEEFVNLPFGARERLTNYGKIELLGYEKPITIINIGANVGTSACAILEANPRAFIFSIDRKPYPEERENIIACGLDPKRVVRLLGDSAEIGTFFPYCPDLVFVDGAHDDKGVVGDIEAWKDKCKSVMLYHDYHHPNYAKKPGVNLDNIVDAAMADWERIGEARYLVGFRRVNNGGVFSTGDGL